MLTPSYITFSEDGFLNLVSASTKSLEPEHFWDEVDSTRAELFLKRSGAGNTLMVWPKAMCLMPDRHKIERLEDIWACSLIYGKSPSRRSFSYYPIDEVVIGNTLEGNEAQLVCSSCLDFLEQLGIAYKAPLQQVGTALGVQLELLATDLVKQSLEVRAFTEAVTRANNKHLLENAHLHMLDDTWRSEFLKVVRDELASGKEGDHLSTLISFIEESSLDVLSETVLVDITESLGAKTIQWYSGALRRGLMHAGIFPAIERIYLENTLTA